MLSFRFCGKNVFPPNAISLLASIWEHIALRLYVGSLSYQTTEQELADLFGQVGQVVSATVITDRDSGRSKGFGFVEMSNDDEARKAIDQLNGTTLGSRQIVVNEAREKRDNQYGGGGGSIGGYNSRGGSGRGGSRSSDRGGYSDRGY
jgi:RNA recognition motif-containing protein